MRRGDHSRSLCAGVSCALLSGCRSGPAAAASHQDQTALTSSGLGFGRAWLLTPSAGLLLAPGGSVQLLGVPRGAAAHHSSLGSAWGKRRWSGVVASHWLSCLSHWGNGGPEKGGCFIFSGITTAQAAPGAAAPAAGTAATDLPALQSSAWV